MPACATPDLFASKTFNDFAPREHRHSPVEQMRSDTYPNIVLRVDESLDATPNNIMWAAWPSFHSKVLDTQWPSTVWTPQPTEPQKELAIIFPNVGHTTRINQESIEKDLRHEEGLTVNPQSSQPEEGFINRSGLARSGIIYEDPFVSRPCDRSPQKMDSQPPGLRDISSSNWEHNDYIAGPATPEILSEGSRRDEEQDRGSAPENCTFSSPVGVSELPEPQLRDLWEALYEIKRIAAATARRDIEDQRTHLGEIFDDGTVPWLGFYDWRLSSEAFLEREITIQLVSELYDALVTGTGMYTPQLVVPYCPVQLVPPTPNQRLLLSIVLTGEGGRL